MKKQVWLGLAVFYLLVRFAFTQWLDSFGYYSSYYFEVLLVLISIAMSFQDFKRELFIPAKLAPFFAVALILGFGLYVLMEPLGIPNPFDFSQGITLFLLLFGAPILEEMIFRYFLWKPIAKFCQKSAFVITTLIFSYSHFHVYWFLGPELHPFIWYQTIYTIGLSLLCGFSVYRYKSILGAICLHFCFNMGFYLASLF